MAVSSAVLIYGVFHGPARVFAVGKPTPSRCEAFLVTTIGTGKAESIDVLIYHIFCQLAGCVCAILPVSVAKQCLCSPLLAFRRLRTSAQAQCFRSAPFPFLLLRAETDVART
jgi:hypothetical protein